MMARNTGILSDSDREFLLGKIEYDGDNANKERNQKRYRLRKKLLNAIEDFTYLERLDERDREMVFQEADVNGLRSVLEFFYAGIREEESLTVQDFLKEAIAEVEDSHAPPGTVVDQVDIRISYTERDPDIDLLRERFEEGEPLTNSEIGALVRVGALGPEELEELNKNEGDSWDLEEIEWRRSEETHPRED